MNDYCKYCALAGHLVRHGKAEPIQFLERLIKDMQYWWQRANEIYLHEDSLCERVVCLPLMPACSYFINKKPLNRNQGGVSTTIFENIVKLIYSGVNRH
jgi:hypothetical protein